MAAVNRGAIPQRPQVRPKANLNVRALAAAAHRAAAFGRRGAMLAGGPRSGCAVAGGTAPVDVHGWPAHDPEWKREILRTEVKDATPRPRRIEGILGARGRIAAERRHCDSLGASAPGAWRRKPRQPRSGGAA